MLCKVQWDKREREASIIYAENGRWSKQKIEQIEADFVRDEKQTGILNNKLKV